MAVEETLPERALGGLACVCVGFFPPTMAEFLYQLHQGWSWRCWSWWGAVTALWESLEAFQSLHSIFSPLCLPFPAQEAKEILARTHRAGPWHMWSSALPGTPAGLGRRSTN